MTDIFEELETETTEVGLSEDEQLFKYAKAIIACQMEIKSIQDDIKQIKSEARQEGVLVKEIDESIAVLKKDAKKMPQEKKLQEEILEKLKENKDILDSIHMIV